jgi:hypothetical protein
VNDLVKILRRLDRLETEIAEIKKEKSAAAGAMEFEKLPDSATVGKDYVAYRFGCTEEAVRRGRAGTACLTPLRVSARPLKWIKRDVDAAWRNRARTKTEKALDAMDGAKKRDRKRRKSIIPKIKLAA